MTPVDQDQRTTAPDGRPPDCQPAWRREFPIDVPEDNYVARRDFTKFVGLTGLAFVVGQFWIVLQNWLRRRKGEPLIQPIVRLEDLPIGGSLVFHYPEEQDRCLLIRTDATTFLAYDQRCTHLSCAVIPAVEKGQLQCPCHRGLFDLASGRPLAGPPRRPLVKVTLEIRKDVIYATGLELRTV